MKTRLGFVSNSSSSSFVIGVKDELTEEKLIKIFKVPENSMIYPVAKSLAKVIIDRAEECTLKDYIEENCGYGKDLSDIVKEIVKKDFKIYHGYASDDEGAMEAALCEMEIIYKDDDIIFEKEGDY